MCPAQDKEYIIIMEQLEEEMIIHTQGTALIDRITY